jgi:hypothetical protein
MVAHKEMVKETKGERRHHACGESVCEPPRTIPFELPLSIEVFVDAEPKK